MKKSVKIVLLAPLSGILVPLADVPDAVFAQKMLGYGIAINPTGDMLVAPCAGTVTQLHKAAHAITLTTPEGVEILMHIGLDTVLLKGQGFSPKVQVGDIVHTGDTLIVFDLGYIKEHATSSLTMLVVSNPDSVVSYSYFSGEVQVKITPVLELVLADSSLQDSDAAIKTSLENSEGDAVFSEPILVVNHAGFHARPSAILTRAAKKYNATILIEKEGKKANAKSVTSLISLDVSFQDSIRIVASGIEAEAAIKELVPLIRSGLGEDLHQKPIEQAVNSSGIQPDSAESMKTGQSGILGQSTQSTQSGKIDIDDPNLFGGIPAAPGLVSGKVFHFRRSELVVQMQGGDVQTEDAALSSALAEGKKQLKELQTRLLDLSDTSKSAVFEAHQELLEDPELSESARAGILSGQSAAFAWQQAFTAQVDVLAAMENKLLAARASDVRDVGRRVLLLLTNGKTDTVEIPSGSILIADDLTPSETANLDIQKTVGFCLIKGSATSHASLLARSSGIVAVVAAPENVLDIADGTEAVLDGNKGFLRIHPDEQELQQVYMQQKKAAKKLAEEREMATDPAVTKDGVHILVAGNIGSVTEVEKLILRGGDGVGLLRSEFLFLQRDYAPSEEEQSATYTKIAQTLGQDKGFIVRTLDVGGDKPLAYLPLPQEMNPFLGIRGIRLNLINPNLLRVQIRAILRAAPFTRLHIMFPMVTSVEEFREVKIMVLEEKEALGITVPVRIGIMVEVPSAALLAENIAAEVDFFSIGTNDLTQYALAVDRGHPKLTALADGLHPAVLRLIALTVEGAHKHDKWVGVCGGLASMPEAIPILIGLGVDELSADVEAIPTIKSVIRKQNAARCKVLAADALTMLTATDVRQYMKVYNTEL